MNDIDDILASVSGPTIPHRKLDLQALTRAWVNERVSPALLPYPSNLVERVMDRIKDQIEDIENLTSTQDPKSNFTLVILQTELERFKFLVRSFLRARIAKIDQFPLHYRQLSLSAPNTLSPLEQQWVQSRQAILLSHYHASFLNSFPQSLQKLDDPSGGISMIDKPDEDTAVFCRVLRDAGSVEIQGETGVGDVDLKRGDVWVLRWSAIQDAVVRGEVELI